MNPPDDRRRERDGRGPLRKRPGLRRPAPRDDLLAASFVATNEGEILECSQAFTRILGLGPDPGPLRLRDFFSEPAELDRALATLDGSRLLSGLEVRLRRRDGSSAWALLSAARVAGTDAGGGRLHGVLVDITGLKRTEDALRESESRYRDLIEHSQAMICTHDLEGNILSFNETAARLLGYDPGSLLVRTIQDILAPETRAGFADYLARLRTTGQAKGLMLVQTRGGERRIWQYHNTLRTEGVPSPIVRGLALDVTERLHAETTSRELAAIVESTDDAIISESLDGLIVSWNLGAERLYGYDAGEARGRALASLVLPDSPDGLLEIVRKVRAGERVQQHETVHRRKDGSLVDVSLTVSAIKHPSGRIAGVSLIVRDISDRRKSEAERRLLENQVLEAQKMEAIGRLAGGVAHDFNNLLTAILGYSDLLLLKAGPNDPLRDGLMEIRQAGERAAALTRQLLAFGRKQLRVVTTVDLNPLISNMGKLFRRLIGEDVEVRIELDPEPARVRADLTQLEQVLMNLVVNSRDAMPRGGRLWIGTRHITVDAETTGSRGAAPAGRYVALSVRDTGVGMDRDTISRIFEPFFTTKERGKGTGLGLASVYGIVKQNDGFIHVESAPGEGSTFEILLPAARSLPGGSLGRPIDPVGGHGSETVLLVEDERSVRDLGAEILRSKGYLVLEAEDGTDALAVLTERPGRVQLVVTDVIMPGMSGPELVERILALAPGTKILYMSGYTDDALGRHGVPSSGLPLLQKPFTAIELLARVREVLDGPGDPSPIASEPQE